MQIINELLFYLESEKWLSLNDIATKFSFPKYKVELILNFLKQNDFLQVDKTKHVFRLHPDMIGLIDRLKYND